MSKICQITGKKAMVGNNVSHSKRRTKRKFDVNLFTKKFYWVEQDFEVWSQKAPNINGMYLPSDGAFIRARAWYKQFYNPRAKYEEYEEQFEGPVYVPKGTEPYTV